MIFNKVFKVCGLVSATTSVGWFASEWKNYYIFEDSRPGLPLYATVSAAAIENKLTLYDNTVMPQPAPNASKIQKIMQFGFPSLSNVRTMSDYVISYDTRNRIPYWVFEHFTADSLAKNENVTRDKAHFHEDDSFHPYFRAQNKDYKGSGFDRGHMAAAGNHQETQKICDETFILSNMAPQVGKGFNRDKWNELESYCRRLVRKHLNVYVCTGPLYLPRQESDGKLYVKYQVIGPNNVSVPTHFYKVVVCETDNGRLNMEVFVLPNEAIKDATPLDVFRVPLEVVERASGLLFFNNLNVKRISKINGLLTS